MTEFAVAYNDEKGQDFCGKPWILTGYKTQAEAEKVRDRLFNNGSQKVFVFVVSNCDCKLEEISWEHAQRNAV